MAGGRFWQPHEIDYVAACKHQGLGVDETYQAFVRQFGETRTNGALQQQYHKSQRIRDAIRRFEDGEPAPRILLTDGPVVTPALTDAPHHDPEQLWESTKRKSVQAIEYHEKRHRAVISFPEDKPVALSFISDQHITESGTSNISRMEEDARLVADTDGIYAVLGGDGVDNHIKHHTAIVASSSAPGHEWLMYDHYLGLFDGKIAAMISGNHDDWTKDLTDTDQVGALARRRRIFYAPDYVLLTLRFPSGQEYVIKVRHQYRYNSSFNETHSIKRMWSEDQDDFDVGVVCHKHRAAMEPFEKHGLLRWACRPGSYQLTSGYSRRYGFGMSTPTCPTIIFFPDQRVMHGFWDVRWAVLMMRELRQGWPVEMFG